MRVLVTGSSGLIGSAVVQRLLAEGDDVVSFDLTGGCDVLDGPAVVAAAIGCDAIVHATGGHEHAGAYTLTLNVIGNWNILDAARQAGIRRVVTFSSVNALGIFRGEGVADYLPIDDEHPAHPPTTYGIAKRLVEELCRCFTLSTGISTVCFRPPAVLGPEMRARIIAEQAADPAAEWTRFWEYGAFLDVRDAAGAVFTALRCHDPGHVTALICADDVTSSVPVGELAARLLPGVHWRGPERTDDPWQSLVRCDRARERLGWSPAHRWRDAAG
jgi:nucleoside-diphosphate-sugar epimerase